MSKLISELISEEARMTTNVDSEANKATKSKKTYKSNKSNKG